MPSKKPLTGLTLYGKKVRQSRKVFSCPDCEKELLPKEYEKHCLERHNVNGKTICVWCRDESWKKGMKNKHASHLQLCFKNFMINQCPLNQSRQPLRLLNFTHAFPQKTLFDFTNLPTDDDSIWPLGVDPLPVTFRDDNLNLASSYVAKYLETRDTHDWMHVMVKAIAFGSFVRAMDLDGGITRTLLFSCWCDGGSYDRAVHRQHRHLIVVSPKIHFGKSVWPKVGVSKEDKPNPNFPCKRFKCIKTPLHLVFTMGYLSHRKSRCEFTFKENRSTPYKLRHFYLYRTLPVHYRLPLVLLWDGGIAQLRYVEKFQNVSISRILENEMIFEEGRWKQKFKDFYDHESGWVLPVTKNFVATKQVTPRYLHLMDGKKLHFENDPENESLDDETWLAKQARGGNCFYDAVGDQLWTLRKRDQRVLNVLVPVVEENKNLKRELEQNEKSQRIAIDELRKENESQRIVIDELRKENKSQRSKMDELYEKINKIYEDEIARLKTEIVQLKLEKKKLKDENERLKKQLDDCKLKEYKQNNEIAKLKLNS